MKYWTEEKLKSMQYDEVIDEIKSILKNYHYESKEQHISKDVVTSLENIVGAKCKDDWKIARSE